MVWILATSGSRKRNVCASNVEGYSTVNGFCYTRFSQVHEADHRGSHILERSTAVSRKRKLRCFQIGKYLNHCVIVMVFLWSSSKYDSRINNSGQDSLTKTFFELQFRSRLEANASQFDRRLFRSKSFRSIKVVSMEDKSQFSQSVLRTYYLSNLFKNI